MSNQLGQETSPYLRQHAEQPVQWRAWSNEALLEAQRLDKPLLLSIGYAACHWCHVMSRESFEHGETAALINELFVPIKVDREERPDLDASYQRALVRLTNRGGWPLTLFLTPAGEPFGGGTYFPRVGRRGEIAFAAALQQAATDYRTHRTEVVRRAGALSRELAFAEEPAETAAIDARALDRYAALTARQIDPLHGGLLGTPKFPNCSVLEFLWRGYLRTRNSGWKNAVVNSLTRMSQGGIYDHLGGGFARYSTDVRWLTPHFEKMLYDNAQLIDLLTWVWLDTKKELLAARVRETIDWTLREMRLRGGGFAAALDAETEQDEGAFYLWTEAEIDRGLGADAVFFKEHYDVTAEGNYRGRTILNRLRSISPLRPDAEARLARLRGILAGIRSGRPAPRRDGKLLADWNALLIAALVNAARAFGRPDWLQVAQETWHAVVGSTRTGGDGIAHSVFAGRTHPGVLDDYAALCRAGLLLHEATQRADYLEQVIRWVGVVEARFKDPAGPGYFLSDDAAASPMGRLKTATDDATPPGNAVLVEVFGRLHLLTGDEAYRTRADEIVAGFSGLIAAGYLSATSLLNSSDFLLRSRHVVLVGEPEATTTREMRAVVHSFPSNQQLVTCIGPEARFPAGHPLHGKGQVGQQTTAYVCEGHTCSVPIVESEGLRARLAGV